MDKTILYINDEYCLSLEQLKGYFAKPLVSGSKVYNELLTLQHDGLLAKWLSEGDSEGEKLMAQELEELSSDLTDTPLMNELKLIFTGSEEGFVKPNPSQFLELTGIKCFINDRKIPLFEGNRREYYGNINLMKEDFVNGAIEVSFEFSFKVLKKVNEEYPVRLAAIPANSSLQRYFLDLCFWDENRSFPYPYPTPPVGRLSPNNHRLGSTVTISVPNVYIKESKKIFVLTVDEKVWAKIHVAEYVEKWRYVANGVSFDMVYVQGDRFMMGATEEQSRDARSNEKEPHWVAISDFFIGETPVTQELWQAVTGDNPSCFKGECRPVEQVSWVDCQTFINKLNDLLEDQLNGKKFHLPTEAQWEFAARGGKERRGKKYAGSDILDEVAWYLGKSDSMTHDVKTKAPNGLDIYDMSGNVREWCSDWWNDSYSGYDQNDPTGPESGSYHVIRGGSWNKDAASCRVSSRDYNSESVVGGDLGLRLALW